MSLQPTACTCVVLVLLVMTPSRGVAQGQRGGSPPDSVQVADRIWLSTVADSVTQSPTNHSPSRTIAIHAAVGTGAGLVIGLLLSGASMGDDRTSVVVTWTALGAAAGVVSGVVTWLVGRRQ